MNDDTPDLPVLNGPTMGPVGTEPPKKLVILCHGVGSDGDDLLSFAPFLQKVLPDALFVAPHAPFPFDGGPMGYQWFSLQDMSANGRAEGVRMAAPILDAFIDKQLSACGLTDKDLALVGFSQGTMMALHVGLRRRAACAGIIGYSGMLIDPESLDTELTAKPPVLLCHGQADDIVPFDFMPAALTALRGAGIPAEGLARPGLGHGVDDDCIKAGMFFLADCFGVNLQSLK